MTHGTDDRTRVLVCFGDSNTHGSPPMRHLDDLGRFSFNQRWTGVLTTRLGVGWRVHEEGLPGRTTVHADPIEGAHLSGVAAVPMIVGTHSPIDTVVLMLGTNDLKPRFAVGASDIVASIEVLVQSIRQMSQRPGRTVPNILVVAPPPILETGCLAEMFRGGRAKSEALAPLLRPAVAKLGAQYIDAAEYIRSSELDGVHFDADQHHILARVIHQTLIDAPDPEPDDGPAGAGRAGISPPKTDQ